MRIIRLREEDLAMSAALVRRAFADVALRFALTRDNCPGNGAFVREEALAGYLAPGAAMFGLFDGAELSGFVAVKRETGRCEAASPDGVWRLEKLAVAPERRGRGHGAALLERALAHARRNGARIVRIGVIADNAELTAWYERRGFARTRTRSFSGLPFVVQFMEKRLAPEREGSPGHAR